MIYTSYFAMVQHMPENVIPVGIALYPPSFFKGHNLKECTPTTQMLNDYKNGTIDFIEYDLMYRLEVLQRLNLSEFLSKLDAIAGVSDVKTSKEKHVALCCFEKDRNECHRKLLSADPL